MTKGEKKGLIVLVCFLLFGFLSIHISNVDLTKLTTDSGFDSDWDSGSSWDSGSDWDSGSSWDHDSSRSRGGNYKGPSDFNAFLWTTVIFISLVVLVSLISEFKKSLRKNNKPNITVNKYSLVVNKNEVDQLLLKNNLKEDEILDKAYEIYIKVQEAWMNDTLDDVKELISDDMYNEYSSQLATLRVKNEQNVMSDFEKVKSSIIGVNETDTCIYLNIVLMVKCKDYLINKNSNEVIRGNSNKINKYFYRLKFMIGKETVEKCPNCGAPLNSLGASVTCEYCNNKIVRLNKNMILVDKKMIMQS